jgi:hypothetical protein
MRHKPERVLNALWTPFPPDQPDSPSNPVQVVFWRVHQVGDANRVYTAVLLRLLARSPRLLEI